MNGSPDKPGKAEASPAFAVVEDVVLPFNSGNTDQVSRPLGKQRWSVLWPVAAGIVLGSVGFLGLGVARYGSIHHTLLVAWA